VSAAAGGQGGVSPQQCPEQCPVAVGQAGVGGAGVSMSELVVHCIRKATCTSCLPSGRNPSAKTVLWGLGRVHYSADTTDTAARQRQQQQLHPCHSPC
jgi:hypothetical protein